MSSPTLSPLSGSPPPDLSFGGYVTSDDSPVGVSFWPRVAARLIDLVVHYAIALVAGFGLGIVVVIVAAAAGADPQAYFAKWKGDTILTMVMALLGQILYHTMCEGLHGSTVGKLILGQVVVTTGRKPCGLVAALKRSLAYFFDGLFFGAVGYFHMQKTKMMQRYGDDWADTVVCKRSQLPPESLRGGGRFVLALLAAAAMDGAFITLGIVLQML